MSFFIIIVIIEGSIFFLHILRLRSSIFSEYSIITITQKPVIKNFETYGIIKPLLKVTELMKFLGLYINSMTQVKFHRYFKFYKSFVCENYSLIYIKRSQLSLFWQIGKLPIVKLPIYFFKAKYGLENI